MVTVRITIKSFARNTEKVFKCCHSLRGVFCFSADDQSLPILIFYQNRKNAFRVIFFWRLDPERPDPAVKVHGDLSRVSVAPLAPQHSVNPLLRVFLWIYTQNDPDVMFAVVSFPMG